MKISIAVSILILAVTAGIGWHDEHRLASARERNARVVSQAAALGISLNSANHVDSVLITKRERENHNAGARRSVDEFMAMVKEAEAIEKNGGKVDPAMGRKIMERLASFSAAEAEILVTGMLEGNELNGKFREVLTSISMLKLANDGPQSALGLLPRLSGVFHDKEADLKCREAVLNTSLTVWSRKDPVAATAWVRENGARFSESITESTKYGILSGAVAHDPVLAFKLIGELGIEDSGQAITTIARAARTPEERTATLTALRGHLATFTDETSRSDISKAAVQQLAFGSHEDGFDATNQWLAAAKLSPAESDAFITTLAFANVKGDTVKWIDWIEKNLPADKADDRISILVWEWTRADYQAAGKWLAAAPAGPVKNISVRTYAGTVAEYNPETAAQWAMTLPPGKDRDSCLKQIYQNWPEDRAEAKEVFAKEHGIRKNSE